METEIAAVPRSYADCVRAKDPTGLLALYDPAGRVFDTWAPWSFESTAERQQSIHDWLTTLDPAESVRVTFEDVKTVAADHLACLTAFVTYAAIGPDERVLRSLQNRLTWVLAFRDGGWRIVHEHTSVPIGDQMKPLLNR